MCAGPPPPPPRGPGRGPPPHPPPPPPPRAALSGSTCTVTSIGSIGGLFSYTVINVPEAAILGVHKIVKRPVVREGTVVSRDMMYLSLSFDHRLLDGGTATRFMNDVILQIESISIA